MRHIRKGAAPAELSKYLLTPDVNYDGAPLHVKDAIRRDCIRDQFGLCAYCCGPLEEESRYRQIKHLVARSVDKNRSLDWLNLLVSCASGQPRVQPGQRSGLTCDDHKGAAVLPISPLSPDCESHFLYSKDTGQIIVRPGDNPAHETVRILNLDCQRLRANRLAAMEEAERALCELSLESWRRRFLEPTDGRLPPYEPAIRTLVSSRTF